MLGDKFLNMVLVQGCVVPNDYGIWGKKLHVDLSQRGGWFSVR